MTGRSKGGTREAAGLPPARAVELAGMVRYARGSVVSRTLAKSAAGTVTLFAFDAGPALSEHTAPFDAIVQILEGEVALTIGGKGVRAGAGRVVRLPAGVPHALRAVRRFKMLLTMIRSR